MENEEYQDDLRLPYLADFVVLKKASVFVGRLHPKISAKIHAAFMSLKVGKTESLLVKPLKGRIMEASVKQYRIVFCRIAACIYVVDVFKKQSGKTPQRIIKRAEKIYQRLNNLLQ